MYSSNIYKWCDRKLRRAAFNNEKYIFGYSYDAEESCLIGTADAEQLVSFPTSQKHEIMVVQPTNTFDEKAIQPLVARKTISWSQAVHKSPPPNHYDSPSPSLTVQERDGTFEFEDEADHGGGPDRHLVVAREMMEEPEEHLQEIHCVASRYLKVICKCG